MTTRTITSRAATAAILLCALLVSPRSSAATGPAPGGAVVAVDSWSFRREVKHSNLPVVVEFWAPWCGPCKTLSPRLERLASEFQGSIKVVRVNTDESPFYTDLYRVTRLPTVLIVQSGKVVGRLEGAGDLRELFTRLEALAAPAGPQPAVLLAALTPARSR
jgi:thioredoxin 1